MDLNKYNTLYIFGKLRMKNPHYNNKIIHFKSTITEGDTEGKRLTD